MLIGIVANTLAQQTATVVVTEFCGDIYVEWFGKLNDSVGKLPINAVQTAGLLSSKNNAWNALGVRSYSFIKVASCDNVTFAYGDHGTFSKISTERNSKFSQ